MEPKNPGPDVGQCYKLPRWTDEDSNRAGHLPLMKELLSPGEDLMNVLDYEDDVQDLEIAEAIANIPLRQEDVRMQDINAPPGLNLRLDALDMTLIWYGHLRTLDQGQFPWSLQEKTRC